MTSSITATTAKLAKRSLAARLELRRLRVWPLLQVPALALLFLLATTLVIHAATLQFRELVWLRASVAFQRLTAPAPGMPVLSDPQAWDLRARWTSLQASHADREADRIALWREAAAAAGRHVQLRPQWSMSWLNWARISAQLHPAGKDWQQAVLRAIALGDRGWAFQHGLGQLLLQHESFMDAETRAGVEQSLLESLVIDSDPADLLGKQGLLLAFCAEPVSLAAKRVCGVADQPR